MKKVKDWFRQKRKSKEESLKNATVAVGTTIKVNNRLFDKELSKELFKENVNELLKERDGEYFKPDNFDKIVDELFSMNNVFVCRYPSEDVFDSKGEWVCEQASITERGLGERDILKSVQKYLDRGAVVYMYHFYNMMQDIGNGQGLTPTYWWRMVVKKVD